MSITDKAQAEAKHMIDQAQNMLIVPHANVDPDGLGSALACHLLFSNLGKKCTVLCPDTLPESLEFLPGFDKLEKKISPAQDFIVTLKCSDGVEIDKLQYTVENNSVNIIVTPKTGSLTPHDVSFSDGALPYDLIVVVDCADLKLLGSVYDAHKNLFGKIPLLNIDHHPSNTMFGKTQLILPRAASTTEILYEWFCSFDEWKSKITPDIATLLLAGLITDTRSFQNPNTTPRSLEIAAELVECGARQQQIIRRIYKTKPLSTLKIWGRALNNIQINKKERIVWSYVSRADLNEMEADSKETHGIVDDLLSTIPSADIYIMFTEEESGKMKASMRSGEGIDSSRIAASLFDGGGHARAAGFRREGYDNFQLEVLECIKRIIDEKNGKNDDGNEEKKMTDGNGAQERVSGDGAIDIMEKLSE